MSSTCIMTTSSMKSVLVENFERHNWVKTDSETITYNDVINFERATKKAANHCVMCGEDGRNCFIPNQNKDVCRKCDSSYWLQKEFNVVVKFCKGCKTFFALMHYGEKPQASKCSTCRRRGRDNYHNKKMRRGEAKAEAEADTTCSSSASSSGSCSDNDDSDDLTPHEFCSLVNTMTQKDDEVIDVQTLLEYASASYEYDNRALGNFSCSEAEPMCVTNDSDEEDREMAELFTTTWLPGYQHQQN